MPRSQQKAVFAKMTDDKYLSTLEGAEKYQRKRDYLIRKNELADTYEDKIFRAYNDPKLTHRQRMAKISKLKAEAAEKLAKSQKKETSETIVGEIRDENWNRFKKQYNIKEVPVNKDGKAISFERGNIARAEKEVIARKIAKKGKAISPQAVASEVVKKGGRSSDRKAVMVEHKRQLKKVGLTDKNLTWEEVKAKQKSANPNADYDLDGTKNVKDCKPLDKKKHLLGAFALGVGASFVGSKLARSREKKREENES